MEQKEYYEWLEIDRLGVIRLIINSLYKEHRYYRHYISDTTNKKRDMVLKVLLNRVKNVTGKDTEEKNIDKSICIIDKSICIITSAYNADCVRYDGNKVVVFNPLGVCDDNWIDWFLKHRYILYKTIWRNKKF